jgi:hypothetical protein
VTHDEKRIKLALRALKLSERAKLLTLALHRLAKDVERAEAAELQDLHQTNGGWQALAQDAPRLLVDRAMCSLRHMARENGVTS